MPIYHQQQQTTKLIWSNNFSSLKRKVHKLAQNFNPHPLEKVVPVTTAMLTRAWNNRKSCVLPRK